MATLILPAFQNIPAFSYQINLDGTNYTLRYTFNTRMDKWIFDIRTEFGDPIITGVPIISDHPIIERFRDDRLPPGGFFAFDTSGQSVDPGRFDLGNRVQIIYVEEVT